MRKGFTLVELLVATGLFVMGFSVCLGLFLAGMRHRTAAEDHLRLGFAASSLVEEIGLGEKLPVLPDRMPASYVTATDTLLPVPGHPHVWYRIEQCQNAVVRADDLTTTINEANISKNDANADALLATLLIVSWTGEDSLAAINRRLRIVLPSFNPDDANHRAQVADHLVARQLALRMQTVILRQP